MYNSMFAFTSPGMKFDKHMGGGKGPPVLRLQGQPCHRMGSMLPKEGEAPKFAQLYIYDTDREVANRIQSCGNNKTIDPSIVANLAGMLDVHNVHAKVFRMARDRLKEGNVKDLKLRLLADRKTNGRIYNLPTVYEVAALIVGDVDAADTRDIIVQEKNGKLTRIDEFHSAYLAYQYPLLFPYGEDGFRRGTLHKEKPDVVITKRIRLTIMDWLSFRIQMRKLEAQTLFCSRRLFQQFLVDGYTMMEAESKRYMNQLYFDGMAISAAVGFPDLFITFTCNPNWPEITRLLSKQNLKAHDRPNIITRVFKIKFNELLKDLTKKHVLGKVMAYLYTIEFQKRGLPHAHILLFLHPSSKYPTPDDINNIIYAEIPNPATHKELMMLTVVKGPTSYDDIKKIGDTQYFSYRDACFAMGFLGDDREYINAIKEAKNWGSGHFLRKLFVIMLLTNTMHRPRHVGITSQLLPGGRTAHSKFKILVPTLDNSKCEIEHNDEHAGLLKQTKLIIWDEAPMAHRFTFEALERTLRDVMSSYTAKCETIFGGKVIIFGGDFRQIFPVVLRGSRSDIVHASINASKIRDHCKVLSLTENMRLKRNGNTDEIEKFSKWILKVGEGKISEPNDGYAEVDIPKELLIVDYDDPIHAIVQSTYPNLVHEYKSPQFLSSRAILVSTIDIMYYFHYCVLGN
ncbi:hypothetical protein TSUD_134940 [Trifolium subterraneum]|uniref:ATP-dependent DNA helicase n=1 Tax=Trifolium subterraneum TaxID=3900 RepID=A0A2Z6LT55_TRISU|nr:hypothetical protein TSUD_134940 [Trifolium subterraneum]